MSAENDRRAELLALRASSGLSQAGMARKLETPLNTYKQWESGARRTPGVAVVAARALVQAKHPPVRRSNAEWMELLRHADAQGWSLIRIAKENNIHPATVQSAVRSHWRGPWRHKEPQTHRDWPAILTRADAQKMTQAQIAAEEGIHYTSVRDAVAHHWNGPWPHKAYAAKAR